MEVNKIYCGDCLKVMKGFPDNSIDTIITDPPYGISFMGKKWDYDVPSVEIWQECLRVLKPGGTALIFAGSRTQHRMAVNVEDAGFILKDCIMWLYGSGFPKATDISKQIDKNILRVDLFTPFAKHFKAQRLKKNLSHRNIAEHFLSRTGGLTGCVWNWENAANVPTLKQWKILKPLLDLSDEFLPLIERIEAEREVIGKNKYGASSIYGSEIYNNRKENKILDITIPKTPEAILWNGYKSHGLKPAYEPILVAMKPNEGSYANNALKWGVAGLNIEEARIPTNEDLTAVVKGIGTDNWRKMEGRTDIETEKKRYGSITGRYPANVILDEEAGRLLDKQSGNTSVTGKRKNPLKGYHQPEGGEWFGRKNHNGAEYQDTGGASRFFYCAKASKSERNRGCEGLESKAKCEIDKMGGSKCTMKTGSGNERNVKYKNHHPTVKPLALMKYLCTLTKTPTGGIVLDPFAGSGTTLMACKELKRDYIGIEKDPEYCEIAERRIQAIPETLF